MATLPIYKACITDEETGIVTVSLVEYPATETDWVAFDQHKPTCFSIQDEDKRLIVGPIMRANQPIYRKGAAGEEYYIMFDKDTIRKMAEKMLFDNTFNNIDIQHNGELLQKGLVSLVELFIVDKEAGVNPSYLDVEDGSLIGVYKVNDDDLWNECKNGTFLNGFSLEGCFAMEPVKQDKFNKIDTMKNLREQLKRIFAKLSDVTTKDGAVLYWEGEGELEVGTEVTLENGEVPADGDYELEDGTIVVIADGVVAELKKAEEPAEPEENEELEEVEEPAEPVEAPATDWSPEIEAIKAEITNVWTAIEELKKAVQEIAATPAAEPIVEEFEKILNDKEDKWKKLGESIKNISK